MDYQSNTAQRIVALHLHWNLFTNYYIINRNPSKHTHTKTSKMREKYYNGDYSVTSANACTNELTIRPFATSYILAIANVGEKARLVIF